MFFLGLGKDVVAPFLVYVVGPTLGAVAFVFEYWAVAVLKRQEAVTAWLVFPPLALLAILAWFRYAQIGIPIVLATSNFAFAVMMIRCAVSFAHSEGRRRRLVDGAAVFSFATLALTTLLGTAGYLRSGRLSDQSGFNSSRIIYSSVVAVVVGGMLFGLFVLAVAERLNDDLSFQSLRDPLTGAYNRQAFEEIGQHEISVAARNNVPLSLFLVDIDHFKRFNAQYGYSIGDFILRAAARTLEASLREEDYICRWGGDEFCALLRRATREDTERVAERTLAAFREIDIVVQGEQVQVGINIGIVTREGNMSDFVPLVKLADAALVRAKEKGSNSFVMA
jgi:diguanylate cyclase (GGDEF)-like protein